MKYKKPPTKGRFSSTNGNVTYISEIVKLVENLNTFFGYDIDKLGEVKKDEFESDEWNGRKWRLDDITFRLIRLNGYFQLYFDL